MSKFAICHAVIYHERTYYFLLMKKSNSASAGNCCSFHAPIILPLLIRLIVGVLFVVMAYGKLKNPEMFQGMLASKLSLSGTLGMIAYWLVVIFEGVGGLAVLLGKLVPRSVYRLALFGQLVIILVAYFSIHLPNGDKPWYFLLLGASLLGLMFASPRCPFGITGYRSNCCGSEK